MNDGESFSRFLKFRYLNQHPIINLIQIRCSPQFISKLLPNTLENTLFNDLVFFESNQIQILSKRLINNSIFDSFQPFLKLFNFNCTKFIDSLEKFITNHQMIKNQRESTGKISNHLIIVFFFYILEFLLFHKQFLHTGNEKDSRKQPNSRNSQKQIDVFVKLIRELNVLGKPKDELIESVHSYLFIQIILHFLNYDTVTDINQLTMPSKLNCHVEWTQEMYDQCAVQFLIGPVFRMSSNSTNKNYNSAQNQFAFSLILTRFTQKAIKSSDSLNPSKILEIIYSLLIEQRVDFDNIQICSILLPLIHQINTKAIKIVSILSSTSVDSSSNIKDIFIQLPPLIFQKVMGNAINEHETKNDDESSTESFINHPMISKEIFLSQTETTNDQITTQNEHNEKQTKNQQQQQLKLSKTKSDFFDKKRFYKEKDPKAFENGFISTHADTNINLFDLFNQNNMNHFLIEFFYSMENANNECLDEYIFSYFKLLSIYLDSEFYFDLYLIGLLFVDKFKDRINLEDLFNFLFEPQIFNPNLTIFNNYDNKNLSIVTTVRFNILNIYAIEMDSMLPNFFIKSENNYFLFTEMIVYIIQTSNYNNNNSYLKSFISEKFFKSFFKVVNSLIRERYEKNNEKDKDGIFSAFQTNLSFLFNFLNDQFKGESLFQIQSFCRKFLSLVFIDSLQKVVLTTIRNILLKASPASMALSPITICICQLLQTLQSKTEDTEQSLSISISIVQNLISLLSSNGSISPFFSNIFDFVINLNHFPNLLEYSLTFTSLISRNIPNFKLKSYQLKRLAHIIVSEHIKNNQIKDIDESQSEVSNITDQTYLLLLNLCAATTTLGNSTMFLIKQPTFVPLVFIVFQNSSSKLRYILQNFIDLCNYSISNCFACHFSGIDLLLLDFIYNFKIKNTNKVNFREIEFNLNFKLEDITKYILPFISMILTYATDSVVISKIIEIINEYNHNDVSLTMSSFFLNSITNSKAQLSILHPLGYDLPFLTVNNVDPDLLNKRFVLTFWIKIDKLISLSEKESIEILRISNKKAVYRNPMKLKMLSNYIQSKEPSTNLKISQSTSNLQEKTKDNSSTTFRLFVKRGVFYYSFYTPGSNQITEQIFQNIESNQWFFCAFVTQRCSPEMSSTCLYSGNHVGYCQDVSKIYFPSSYPLTISFGGKGSAFKDKKNKLSGGNFMNDHPLFKNANFLRNKLFKDNQNDNFNSNNSIQQNEGNLVGVLGPFALFNELLSEEELSSISKAGPSLINDDFDGWLIKSSKSPTEFSIQKALLNNVKIKQNDSSFAPHSIISEVCLHNHIIQLSKPFFNINKVPENFMGTIIGIMKQIFLTSSSLQKEFVYFDIIAKLMISSSYQSKDDNESSQNIRINYHLYLNFLSLFECISSELFFDTLLVNVELWFLCCNSSNFSRIIFHWSHTLINMYPSFFKRPNFLLKLYKTYFELFDRDLIIGLKLDDIEFKKPIINYSKEELNECSDRFRFLLEEATKISESFEKDFLLYFYSIISHVEKQITSNDSNENENDNGYYQKLKFFLNILIKNANKFKKCEEFVKFSFHLISEDKYSNESEIIKLSIFALHELYSPDWFESMSKIGFIILNHQRKSSNKSFQWGKLVKSLLSDIEYYPGIMHLVALFILGTNSIENDSKEENDDLNISDLEFSDSVNILINNTVFSMRDKDITPVVIKSIISDKYWFLWLLFIAIQTKDEDHRQPIMLLISNFASFSENPEKQLDHLIEVIFIFNSFVTNIDEYAILLDLFVNILAHGTIPMISASTSLILSIFFKFCFVFHNNSLIEQIESSPLFEKGDEAISYYDDIELDKDDQEMNSFENIENNSNKNEENSSSINQIMSDFLNFAKNENKIKNYKLRFGLSMNQYEKNSSLEKLYDLLIQTLQIVNFKLNFPGYKKILEFVSIVLKPRFAKSKRKIESNNDESEMINFKLNDAINYFNEVYLNSIFKSIKEIKEMIERIESVQNQEISNSLIDENQLKEKFNNIPILSTFYQKTTVDNYFTFMKNFSILDFKSKKEISRDFYSFLFPIKAKFKEIFNLLPIENIDFYDDDEMKYLNVLSNSPTLVKTKATFYNFDDNPKDVYFILHLHNFLIRIVDIESNLKLFTIPSSSIVFIRTKPTDQNTIEFFTQDQGSFYFTFHEQFTKEKESIISRLKHSMPYLTKTVKESLIQYFSQKMTNYEYLMYLNIISGCSFHDPDLANRPTFPRLKTNQNKSVNFMLDEVPVFNFLSLNDDQLFQSPFMNLDSLEMIDDSLIDYYAKAKYNDNYLPKFIPSKSQSSEVTSQNNEPLNQNETHRIIKDLSMNPNKIRKAGFIHMIKDGLEYHLFYIIIKKEGLIHFIQISNDLFFQYLSTQKTSLLYSNDNMENEDEEVVIIEDFRKFENDIEKVPGILIFSKRKKKLQKVTPFECSPLIDLNFELCSTLFSSLYSFSYVHQSSSSTLNSIRSSSASFYVSKSSFLTSSNTASQIKRNEDSFNFYHSYFCSADTDPNLFSMNNKELIFVYNKCNIKQTINMNDLLCEKVASNFLVTHDFFTYGSREYLNSKITCIASSEKFKALAVGKENCKVVVYSLNSKEVTTIIDLNNKEPEKILITPNYGLIVIEAQKTVYVYTINGQKIGEKEINFDILEWHFSYLSVSNSSFGLTKSSNEDSEKKKDNSIKDYIIFMNSVNDIGVFEAAHPDKIQFISTSSGLIAAFDYLSFCNCVIIISINYGSIIGFYPVQDFSSS